MISKTSLILSTLFLFVSCSVLDPQRAQDHQGGKRIKGVKAREISSLDTDVPAAAKTWDADIYLVNFNAREEEKVVKAIGLMRKVIASKEFKDRILNYTYQGKKQFHDNGELTNLEIYQKILDGAEQMGNTTKNNMMDAELELYTQATKTIGYTYPNTVRIWMNKKYFDRYTPVKVADNLMHEWMHKLGFTHATSWSKSRDHSVPYAVGYLLENLARNLKD